MKSNLRRLRTLCLLPVIAAGALAFSVGGASAQPESHAFLCYSHFSDDVQATLNSDVAKRLSEGYWIPWAVAGNVTTPQVQNIGKYHLTCTKPSGDNPNELGEGGEVLPTTPGFYGGVTGVYPIIG